MSLTFHVVQVIVAMFHFKETFTIQLCVNQTVDSIHNYQLD